MARNGNAAGVGARRGISHHAGSWWHEYSTTPLTEGMTHGQIVQGLALSALFIATAWALMFGACVLHDWLWCR